MEKSLFCVPVDCLGWWHKEWHNFFFPSKARVVIKDGDVDVSDSDDEDDSKYKED